MSEPVKLVIVMEGGMLTAVLGCGVPVRVAVIDYDADQGDDDDAIDIAQGDGTTERAWVSIWQDSPVDPDTINHPCSGPSLFALAKEHGPLLVDA